MTEMKTFYLTFGQKYPWSDCWVEVEAPDYDTARNYVEEIFDKHYANLYEEKDFNNNKVYFPGGKVGRTIK